MRSDSTNYVKRCNSCQCFAEVSHLPPEHLTLILSLWPFMKWEIDIMRKLSTAPGQWVYMHAVIYYFTKWVEAEAYHQVLVCEVKNFIWKNVICCFGVPKEIVTDNGSQFISFDFQDFCKEWGIKLSFSNPRVNPEKFRTL